MSWMIKVMTVDPVDFENWAYMAIWLELIGLPDIAQIYLDRAYELGPEEPVVLKCDLQIRSIKGQKDEVSEIARRAIDARLDDRWYSNRIFLRQIRDDASSVDELTASSNLYRDRHPELFEASPTITVDNVNTAADLAFLLRRLGQDDQAQSLIDSSLDWYQRTWPQGVYGWAIGIVEVDLLVAKNDYDAALRVLGKAVDSGWNYNWTWYIDSPNYDPIRERPEFQAVVSKLKNDMKMQRDSYLALPDMGEFDLRN
jgi:tetratricopeptide (TPR) repeat protein